MSARGSTATKCLAFGIASIAGMVLPSLSHGAMGQQAAVSSAATPTPVPTPTGRQGRGGFPLPPLPAVFETYQQKVRVSVVARGLDRPCSLLILPDGEMLVSLRFTPQIRAIRNGVLDPTALTGLPEMRALYDLVVHPKFAENSRSTSRTRSRAKR